MTATLVAAPIASEVKQVHVPEEECASCTEQILHTHPMHIQWMYYAEAVKSETGNSFVVDVYHNNYEKTYTSLTEQEATTIARTLMLLVEDDAWTSEYDWAHCDPFELSDDWVRTIKSTLSALNDMAALQTRYDEMLRNL